MSSRCTSPLRAKKQCVEPICKNPVVWNNCFCSRSFGELLSNIIFLFLLVIWAPHSRPAVQASDLVKDPKILLETFIKIQTVERNLTVQCVQFSSSSQSGFLPCYHLKMKGMHPYFFCPGRSRSIPTRIRVQAVGLSYYMEMGEKRPKLPSDRLCSFSRRAEKERCAYWRIAVAVRSEQESVLAAARCFIESGFPRCKKKFSMVMLRLQCIHFLVLLPSSTLGSLPRELSGDR